MGFLDNVSSKFGHGMDRAERQPATAKLSLQIDELMR